MTAGQKHERLRAALVVSEVALACVLLVGAGLLLRSFLRVLDVDLGFQPDRAAVIKVDYDDGGNPERRGAVLQEMLRNIQSIPGVEAAGIADMLPLGRNRSWGLSAKGKIYPKGQNLSALVRIVTPGYLKAMGMHLKDGRDFTWQDTPKSERVDDHQPGSRPAVLAGRRSAGTIRAAERRRPRNRHHFRRTRA